MEEACSNRGGIETHVYEGGSGGQGMLNERLPRGPELTVVGVGGDLISALDDGDFLRRDRISRPFE